MLDAVSLPLGRRYGQLDPCRGPYPTPHLFGSLGDKAAVAHILFPVRALLPAAGFVPRIRTPSACVVSVQTTPFRSPAKLHAGQCK